MKKELKPRKHIGDVVRAAAKLDDTDAAVLMVMDAIGVTSGDWSSIFFCGDEQDGANWNCDTPDRPKMTYRERVQLLIKYVTFEMEAGGIED